MASNDVDRRTFLRTGSGLIVAAALGGCASTQQSRSTTAPGSGPSTSPLPPDALSATTLPPEAAPAGATQFVPTVPTRIVDTTRTGEWATVDAGRIRVPVVGRARVPASATAAVVRATASDADDGVTVVPAGDLGLPDPGPARTRTCFVLLADGGVDVLHDTSAVRVTLDVLGWFEPAATATSAGRIVAIEPTTIVDTAAAARPFTSDETRSIAADRVCPPDALAVLVRLTATSDASGGEWTARPIGGADAPGTLTADPDRPDSASTLVPLVDGAFEIASQAGGHAVVEVDGYVTGTSAPVAVEGLFVPTPPRRLLDTRDVNQPIPDGSSREVDIGPDAYGAVALGIAAVPTRGTPTTSVWGAGSPPAFRPSLGGIEGVESYQAVAPAGRRGVAIGAIGGAAHVVADLHGWFVGTRSTSDLPVLGWQPYGIQGVDMESLADEWLDYGMSTDGRPLRAFRCGSGPRVGLITTGLHGDEHTGTSVLADLVTHGGVEGWTLWLVPIANPDARAANTRFVHEVDMNRDFPVDWNEQPTLTGSGCVTTRTGPVPHSLVESRQLAAAMVDGPFRAATISISHHDNYNWVAPQSGSPSELRDLATRYADATGLRRPGEGGSTVPTSPRSTHVDGGFETFAHSLGMSSFLVENKAGYVGGSYCAGTFGVLPAPEDVAPHHDALRALLTDGRLPA